MVSCLREKEFTTTVFTQDNRKLTDKEKAMIAYVLVGHSILKRKYHAHVSFFIFPKILKLGCQYLGKSWFFVCQKENVIFNLILLSNKNL